MSWVIGSRMVHNDVLVRRNRQPNVDFKSGAMTMLVTWSNNGYAAPRNALIVCFQSFDLFKYRLARSRWRFGAFEANFWSDLHFGPFAQYDPCQSACGRMVAPGNVRS
jgi:hypothetical protein